MVLFESAVEGSLEGSRGDRVHLRRHAHRATGTPLWRTPLAPGACCCCAMRFDVSIVRSCKDRHPAPEQRRESADHAHTSCTSRCSSWPCAAKAPDLRVCPGFG